MQLCDFTVAQRLPRTLTVLVEMLNIVGERERPNLGFARDVQAA